METQLPNDADLTVTKTVTTVRTHKDVSEAFDTGTTTVPTQGGGELGENAAETEAAKAGSESAAEDQGDVA